jgi:acyl-CoA thioester hydrolase
MSGGPVGYSVPFPFQHNFRVRYAETDAQGIVFYGNYLIYFDTAIYEYLKNLEFNIEGHIVNTGADFHVAHVSADYQAPARFDDDLTVEIRVFHIGRSSLVFHCQVWLSKTQAPLVTGKIVWVNVDQQTQRSVPLPKDLISRIQVYEGSRD